MTRAYVRLFDTASLADSIPLRGGKNAHNCPQATLQARQGGYFTNDTIDKTIRHTRVPGAVLQNSSILSRPLKYYQARILTEDNVLYVT